MVVGNVVVGESVGEHHGCLDHVLDNIVADVVIVDGERVVVELQVFRVDTVQLDPQHIVGDGVDTHIQVVHSILDVGHLQGIQFSHVFAVVIEVFETLFIQQLP